MNKQTKPVTAKDLEDMQKNITKLEGLVSTLMRQVRDLQRENHKLSIASNQTARNLSTLQGTVSAVQRAFRKG